MNKSRISRNLIMLICAVVTSSMLFIAGCGSSAQTEIVQSSDNQTVTNAENKSKGTDEDTTTGSETSLPNDTELNVSPKTIDSDIFSIEISRAFWTDEDSYKYDSYEEYGSNTIPNILHMTKDDSALVLVGTCKNHENETFDLHNRIEGKTYVNNDYEYDTQFTCSDGSGLGSIKAMGSGDFSIVTVVPKELRDQFQSAEIGFFITQQGYQISNIDAPTEFYKITVTNQ